MTDTRELLRQALKAAEDEQIAAQRSFEAASRGRDEIINGLRKLLNEPEPDRTWGSVPRDNPSRRRSRLVKGQRDVDDLSGYRRLVVAALDSAGELGLTTSDAIRYLAEHATGAVRERFLKLPVARRLVEVSAILHYLEDNDEQLGIRIERSGKRLWRMIRVRITIM